MIMTKTYARIIDGVVVNVEVWGEEPPTSSGVTFLETDQAVRGDLWDGQALIRLAPEADRRLLPKSTVTARLIDLGMAGEVKTALDADAVSWARWISPDWPNVYADDDGLLAFLAVLGLTKAQIALVTAP